MKVFVWESLSCLWFYSHLQAVFSLEQGGSELIRTLEVCNQKTANFSCSHSQVILIQKAEYGRMRQGTCVKSNLGFLGCRVNVMTTLDKTCSGKQQCAFFLPIPDMVENSRAMPGYSRCSIDTTSYLEIQYICVNVLPHPSTQCVSDQPILLSPDTGYLAPLHNKLHGSHMCPLILTAADGRYFQLTFFNFNRGASGGCQTIIQIYNRKLASKQEVSTCDVMSGSKRENAVSTLDSSVEITFPSTARQLNQVLIKYQVSGCANLTSSPGLVFKRNGMAAELTCTRGRSVEKSFLRCADNEWKGVINCTSDAATMATGSGGVISPTNFPIGLVLVVAIGVGLGIFLGGLMLICVNVYMKRRHRHEYAQPDYNIHDMDYSMQLGTQHSSKPAELRQIHQYHHPTSPPNPQIGNSTLIPHHNGTEETLISITGPSPRCAKHGTPPQQGVVFDEVICGNIDDLTKSSFMSAPNQKGDKFAAIGNTSNKGRERDHLF